MKINFRIADCTAGMLVVVKSNQGINKQKSDLRRVIVRLFDEATINRLQEVDGGARQNHQRARKWWNKCITS